MTQKKYRTFNEFYPFYLSEHKNTTSRILHFTGTGLFFTVLLIAIASGNFKVLALGPVVGYGFAWAGHFFFEKNKPATFEYPVYSLVSDFKLFFEIVTGKQSFKAKKA